MEQGKEGFTIVTPEMASNKIGDYNLYLGSIYALMGLDYLREHGIDHVISVYIGDISVPPWIKRIQFDADDTDDQNIMQYFEEAIEFINDAFICNRGCLVHCIAGVSRSATIICAYIMRDRKWKYEQAIEYIRQYRPIANPNEGFVEQLNIFYQLGWKIDKSDPLYRQWTLRRDTQAALESHIAPHITDYSPDGSSQSEKGEIRCKKCRRVLANSQSYMYHRPDILDKTSGGSQTATGESIAPTKHQINFSHGRPQLPSPVTSSRIKSALSPYCQHFFVEPVEWMRPELDKGKLEGKLECPKCHAKVGSYKWQGMKCSCGKWVTPGIEIQRGKVDELCKI